MPLWDKGSIEQMDDEFIAEVPVMAPVTIMSALYVHNDSVMVAQYPYMNTGYNLIAQKQEDDTFLFTIARITGDPDYLIDRHKQKKEGLTVADKEHFCGSIRYFTLEGEFIYGEIFQEGIRTATIAQHLNIVPGTAEADSILLRFKEKKIRADSLLHFKTRGWETYCEWIPYWVAELVCTGVYINETYMEDCEYSDVRGHYEYEEVCHDIYVPDPTEPDPGYGGGGGGSPINPPGKDEDKTQTDPSKELPPAEAKALADTIQHFSLEDKNRLVEIANKINEMAPFKKLIDYMSNTLDTRFSLMIIDHEHFEDLAPSLEAICEYYRSSGIGKLYFKEGINEKNFMHEYFHLFQYSITNSEASSMNRGMMEVERMIGIDIMTNVLFGQTGNQDMYYFWETNLTNQVGDQKDKNYLIDQDWAKDYNKLIEKIQDSKKYPSFSDININVKNKDTTQLRTFAEGYGEYLKQSDTYKNKEYGQYDYTVDYNFNALQKLLELLK